jgi:hypothetical protein
MDKTKNQIVERLKQANNVLVTVSNNPTVDQLAACVGLTLLLNKLGKHATAVFSGEVPSTLEFLQPEYTIEKNTDSLRDFIISLDKEKADKLRYKVEDKLVRIFITPYRTSIGEQDLIFSQGDFNVDVVLALGVHEREELDQAIVAHGRILHDATVVSVNTGPGANVGSIHWENEKASSLSEMVVGLGTSLKKDILDAQMATAFLTGIVAETNRFSNDKTTSDTMNVSAKLMGAGANQQLVATKLQEAANQPEEPQDPDSDDMDVPDELVDEQLQNDGSLRIDHTHIPPEIAPDDQPKHDDQGKDMPELPQPETPPQQPESQPQTDENQDQEHPPILPENRDTQRELPDDNPYLKRNMFQQMDQEFGTAPSPQPPEPQKPEPEIPPAHKERGHLVLEPPKHSGKFTASTEPEYMNELTDPLSLPDVNTPLLSHNQSSQSPQYQQPPLPPLQQQPQARAEDSDEDMPPIVVRPEVPLPEPPKPEAAPQMPMPPKIKKREPEPEPSGIPPLVQTGSLPEGVEPGQSLSDIEKSVHSPHIEQQQANDSSMPPDTDDARAAVERAISSAPADNVPLEPIQALGAQQVNIDLHHEDTYAAPTIDPVTGELTYDSPDEQAQGPQPPQIPPPMMPPQSPPPMPPQVPPSQMNPNDPSAPPQIPPPMMPPNNQ